jgi:hypothetical protein
MTDRRTLLLAIALNSSDADARTSLDQANRLLARAQQ